MVTYLIRLVRTLFLTRLPATESIVSKAPEIGVDEEVAQYYFNQLVAGLVCPKEYLSHIKADNFSIISTNKECVIGISNPKIFCSMRRVV